MNKKTMKIITFLLMMVIFLSISTLSFAAVGDKKEDTTTTDSTALDTFIDTFKPDPSKATINEQTKRLIGDIINVIFYIGVVAGIIVIMYLGIKYIIGSPEQKSDYKKSFTPYIVGVLLLVGATTIAKFIFSFATKV